MGEVTITAIIDGRIQDYHEASLRRHLKLEDHDGITSILNSEIFEQLALMGYQTDSDKLTFHKGGRIDEDPNTYFAQDDEVVHAQDTAEEGQLEDSTAGITVSMLINICMLEKLVVLLGRVVYGRGIKRQGSDKGKRKKSLPRKRTRSTTKRQKVELEDEKEDLKDYLDIVPREDVAVYVVSLFTKYPIVDWKTYTLSENFMYYKIIRGDGSSKNYKILSEMLYDFDRQDVVELYRPVKERYSYSKPEGYDLML
ncbi:hypothetical protein Tco_1016403 [Tanacetum coccineum]|uniref:Uncharacterized protein n=1 Tax=Tanacetum coccineum TaxID=301880 RepID=A0ABQ5FPV6_9ASTR